ncbi:DUF6316 family protein [Hahella aquimaris]|uniref:DUF6316 family protein n=1 Tax=Hahella sp. HNIBRBA332 TaxID=3015983 RepID=UPI00273CCDC9|nr:DUF6316 family protein [Hahella sp. HNIBRBA332]WLQ15103.1 DUF6316 family protein [Hahella sp. HNIBRBA332]
MEISKRSNDKQSNKHHRSDRFFAVEGKWYYRTREKIHLGPYEALEEAEDGLIAYLRYLHVAERRE